MGDERKGRHMSTGTTDASENEVTILARVLGSESGPLPKNLVRYFLNLDFSERDQARMHDLVLRNQNDALSPAEKEELFAFGKAGDLIAILKSKALARAMETRNARHPSQPRGPQALPASETYPD